MTEAQEIVQGVHEVEEQINHVNENEVGQSSSPAKEGVTEPDSAPSAFIEEGIVSKRGPFPLRLWQKRLLTLHSAHHSFSLYDLRIVYRKNVKKSQSTKAEFEKVNKPLLETIATATVNATNILSYYKPNSKSFPQGLISLSHINSVELAPKIGPNAFVVKAVNRDYVFNCKSHQDSEAWVRTIGARLESEIHDFSDVQSYKASYEHLVNRKGFFPPSTAAKDEEVFSASEAEFVADEVPKEEASPEVPTESGPIELERPASPSKSFFNGVVDFIYPKTETDPEAAIEVAGEPVKESEEIAAPEETPSPEVVVAEEAHVVEQVENSPSRSKSFSLGGIQTGLFSIFKTKKEDKVEAQPEQEDSEDKKLIPENVEAPQEEQPTEVEATAEEIVEEVPVPATEEAQSAETAEESKSFLVRLLSGKRKSTIEIASPVAEAPEPEAPAEAEIEVDSEVAEPAPEVVEKAAPEAQPEAEEDTRPFLTRLLSGKRKSKIETHSSPVLADEPQAETEIEPVVDPIVEPTAEIEVIDEVETSPESEIKEESRPFLVRLLSGNRKSKIDVPSTPLLPSEPTQEGEPEIEAEAEPEVEGKTPELLAEEPEAVSEAEPEKKSNFISKFVQSKRKSFMEALSSPTSESKKLEAEEEAQAEAQVEPEAKAEDNSNDKEDAPEAQSEPLAEEPQKESDKRPFIVRVLSGKRKSLFGSPASPKPQEPALTQDVTEEPQVLVIEESALPPIQPAEEVEENGAESEAVVKEAAVIEETAQSEAAIIDEAPPVVEEHPTPAPARQASLIARIGEYAYSAVLPTTPAIAEEFDEEINPHYLALAEDADFSGFIFKQSYLLHSNNHRFAILTKDGVFIYYRSAQIVSDGKKIAVDDTSSIEAIDELAFSIKSSSGSYQFSAKSQQDRDAWVSALAKFTIKVAEAETEVEAEIVEDVKVEEPEATGEKIEAQSTDPVATLPVAV